MDGSQLSSCELPPEAIDDLFGVLSSAEARHVVRYFRPEPRSVADLDSLVEYSLRLADGDPDRDKRTIALHHAALPKLADAGVLDYDARRNTVRYRGCPVAERLVARAMELEAGGPTGDDWRERAREHLEDALEADDPATKDYHVREALQFLRIADEANDGGTDADDDSGA